MFHGKKVNFLAYVVATNGVTMNEKKWNQSSHGKSRPRSDMCRFLLDLLTFTGGL